MSSINHFSSYFRRQSISDWEHGCREQWDSFCFSENSDECCLRRLPGTAGNCTGCHSRTGSGPAGRSCRKSFPAAGPTGPRDEPEQQPTVGMTSPCGSLEKRRIKIIPGLQTWPDFMFSCFTRLRLRKLLGFELITQRIGFFLIFPGEIYWKYI